MIVGMQRLVRRKGLLLILVLSLASTFFVGCRSKNYNVCIGRDASLPILKNAAETRELINQETAQILEE